MTLICSLFSWYTLQVLKFHLFSLRCIVLWMVHSPGVALNGMVHHGRLCGADFPFQCQSQSDLASIQGEDGGEKLSRQQLHFWESVRGGGHRETSLEKQAHAQQVSHSLVFFFLVVPLFLCSFVLCYFVFCFVLWSPTCALLFVRGKSGWTVSVSGSNLGPENPFWSPLSCCLA